MRNSSGFPLIQVIQECYIKGKTRQWTNEKLQEIAYLFKSIEYRYEHEVRLIVSLRTLFDNKVDIERKPPRVYIDPVSILPAICCITLGPKVEKAHEWAASLYYDILKKGTNQKYISLLPYR